MQGGAGDLRDFEAQVRVEALSAPPVEIFEIHPRCARHSCDAVPFLKPHFPRDAAHYARAHAAFESGARLPERVDAVIETVGEVTWAHSLRCLRPGGAIVIAGATGGTNPNADLGRVFYQQLRVFGSTGSTGSTRHEAASMLRLLEATGVRPRIDRVLPLERIHEGFEAMINGEVQGKIFISLS